jgi:hypothetical protein
MLQLLAQMPGVDEAISAAATSREGWVAVLLVVLVVSTFATFGIVIHRILREATEREKRLNDRIDQLQDFIRGELLEALNDNTRASQALQQTIAKCGGGV